MFRIEKCQHTHYPELQYLHSDGVEDEVEDDDGDTHKVTTYFHPSMVFPVRVELLYITLLCKCKHSEKEGEKVVKIAILNKKGEPKDLGSEYYLRHNPKHEKLVTTFKFPTAVAIDPDQLFYFYSKDVMDSSSLVLGFRNMD